MAYSSATPTISILLLTGFAVVIAAPGPSWQTRPVYTDKDSVAEGQLSPPRLIRRCACLFQTDPETEKSEWFCTADSDPRCHQLVIGDLTIVQEKASHQALASKVEDAVHQCVCYLNVNDETNTLDFSCNHPQCYRLVARKEVASAKSWENFIQCRPGDIHENPCCRCGNNRWICNGQLMCKARPQKCSPELQVEIPGQCCKGCLQKQQSTLGVQKYTTSSQGVEQDDTLKSCECSVCKYTNDKTGDLQLSISRTDPECQCDFQITYPYDDLAECSPKEKVVAMKAYTDNLEKELADVANRSG